MTTELVRVPDMMEAPPLAVASPAAKLTVRVLPATAAN
jgi:hypothetical protein